MAEIYKVKEDLECTVEALENGTDWSFTSDGNAHVCTCYKWRFTFSGGYSTLITWLTFIHGYLFSQFISTTDTKELEALRLCMNQLNAMTIAQGPQLSY